MEARRLLIARDADDRRLDERERRRVFVVVQHEVERARHVLPLHLHVEAEFVNFSFDVKVEGKNVARALDLMLHNDKNTPPFPLIQPPIISIPSDEQATCFHCGKPL